MSYSSEQKRVYNQAWRAANRDKIRAYWDKKKAPFVPAPADSVPDPTYDGYSWTPDGRCWSESRLIEYCNGTRKRVGGYFLKPSKIFNGYYTVALMTEYGVRRVMIAARMMATFGPLKPPPIPVLQPDGSTKMIKYQIDHNPDQDKSNNAISNLIWATPKQNMAHSKGSKRKGYRHMTADDKYFIGMFYAGGATILYLAREWKVSPCTIYRALGFPWAMHKKTA